MQKRRSGQNLAEYTLVIALVAVLALVALSGLGAVVSGTLSSISSSVGLAGAGGSAPGPSGEPGPSGSPAGIASVVPADPTAGETVTITGSGFGPGTDVEIILHPDQFVFGIFKSDADGNLSTTAILPINVALGAHTITLAGTDRGHAALTLTASVTVTAAPPLLVGLTVESGPLYTGNYALATYSFSSAAAGGTLPLTYAWSGPGGWTATGPTAAATTFTCADLPGSGVTLKVNDAVGQQITQTAELAACPPVLVADPATAPVAGAAYSGNYTSATYDLSIAAPTGGATPYTVVWSGPGGWTATGLTAAANIACDLLPGSITLSVTDANGAVVTSTLPLSTCSAPIEATASAPAPTYAGNYTSAAYDFSSTLSGGITPYLLAWSGPGGWASSATSPSRSFACSVLPGTATLAVSDANGQTLTRTVDLAACPIAIAGADASISSGPLYSANYSLATDTFAASIATGGTSPFTYAWSGPGSWAASDRAPSTTFSCANLVGGKTATLTVTDANGASITRTVELTACPAVLGGTASAGTPTYSGVNGTTTIAFTGTATGGASPYTVSWTGPAPLPSSSLSPSVTFACSTIGTGATATFTISDALGANTTRTVVLSSCPPIATASAAAPSYTGNYASATYAFTGTASGGNGSALTSSWTGPGAWTSNALSPSHAFTCASLPGTAILTVSDGARSTTATVVLAACPTPTGVSFTVAPSTFTGNYVSQSIVLTASAVSGGTAPYAYAWTTNSSWNGTGAAPTAIFTCASMDQYPSVNLLVTDANGQSAGDSKNIPRCPAPIAVTSSLNGIPTYDDLRTISTQNLVSTVANGIAPYTSYAWSGPGGWTSSLASPATVTFSCSALGTPVSLTITDTNGVHVTAPPLTIPACPVYVPGPPTFIAKSETVNQNAYGVTVTMPAGVLPGDLLIMTGAGYTNGSGTWTGPAGWTKDSPVVTLNYGYGAGVFSKIATAADVAGTTYYMASQSSQQWHTGTLVVYRNAHIRTRVALTGNNTTAPDATAAVTNAPANSMVIVAGGRGEVVAYSAPTLINRVWFAGTTHSYSGYTYTFDAALPAGGNFAATTIVTTPVVSTWWENVTYLVSNP